MSNGKIGTGILGCVKARKYLNKIKAYQSHCACTKLLRDNFRGTTRTCIKQSGKVQSFCWGSSPHNRCRDHQYYVYSGCKA